MRMTTQTRCSRLFALRLIAALALGAALSAPAAAQYEVLETRDLRLIYPGRSMSFIVPYTARCFENSMRFHKVLWGYSPSEQVNVILDDSGDYGNAGVWAAPRNSMSVQIAPSNFVYETGPSNERINFTMNHEVVHVIALDQTAGMDRMFRSLFHGKVRETSEHPESMLYGYLTLPRRAAPRWYHEGIAVFMETWMAGGLGRAQGPYDEMVFRSMVRDGSHIYDPLGLESEGTKVDFQVGVNSYLYGTRFMDYLAYHYSPEHLIRWVGRAPGSKAYFSAQFRNVFGTSLNAAWNDWIQFERNFQRANLDSVRRYPTTPARDLSKTALGSVSRGFVSGDGRTLYVGVNYPGTVAHIAAISLESGAVRKLQEVKGAALYFVTSLAYDAAGDTLYYTADNNEWRDLFALDPRTGTAHRLIRDARIGDLTFNRKDHTLWGVRHLNGISTVVRLDPPYDNWSQIWSLPYGRDLYDLDISPDGSTLVASMAEISGRQTLRAIKLAALAAGDTSSVTLYDFGTAIPTSFAFTPDGRQLYGSSYYTGVSNIYRYDFGTDSMDVVSNAETGLFRPIPGAGDSLIVFRYSGAGFVPAKIDPHPLSDVSAITFLGAQLVQKHPVLRTWRVPPPSRINLDSLQTSAGPYRARAWIRPTTIYPVVEGYKKRTAFGLRANASDPVAMYTLDATLTYTPDPDLAPDEHWHVALGYQHSQISAGFRYNGASFYDLVGPNQSSRKGYGGHLNWSESLRSDAPRSLDLDVTLTGYGGLERLPDNQNVATAPGFDKLVALTVELSYTNLRASIGAVDHEKGWKGSIEAEAERVRFVRLGDATWRAFPRVTGTLDVGTPTPIRNSSVWLRTAAGQAFGDELDPFANYFFGGFGNNWFDRRDPKRYRDYDRFPGTEIDAIAGTNFGRAMVEWNLPALRFRRAGTLALYASMARLSLFGTALVTDFDREDVRQRFQNLGGQIDVRFQLLTLQPLTLSGGYARAWQESRDLGDRWMISLKLL